MAKDLFSDHAGNYSRFRPAYPEALFEFIIQRCNHLDLAWDCATGNGQVARQLAIYFSKVYATDISTSQLDHASMLPNIMYRAAPAEDSPFDDNSFDLITVGQAIHWFDTDKFFEECKRVGKKGAMLALIGYNPVRIDADVDRLLDDFYFNKIYSYWEAERKIVDDKYSGLHFPFEEINTPPFTQQLNWSLQDLEGYLNTWSSVRKFIKLNGSNPVDDLMNKITPLWKASFQSVYFPVFLKLGRIKG